MHLPSSLSSLLVCLLGAIPVEAENATYWPWQTYKSSALQPPLLNITKSGPTSPGYLFFDQNGPDPHVKGLFIMDDDNELIWQSAPGNYSAWRPQMLDGQPVLTYFTGVTVPDPVGLGYGIVKILDSSYQNIYNISLADEKDPFTTVGTVNASAVVSFVDMHEAYITPQGTILVTAINVTQYDLSSIGGPVDGWVADSLFYEIDIKTNKILFRWRSSDHLDQLPLTDSAANYAIGDIGRNSSLPYGYFHINAVQKLEDGSYLVSSRFYCSVFKINGSDGSIIWTLQGRDGGDFELGPGLSFCYQHNARVRSQDGDVLEISIFNNDNYPESMGVNQTTGIFMTVDTANMTATLKQQFVDPDDTIYTTSQGDNKPLPDGHVILGYGNTPKIKEFSPDGKCVMTAQFGQDQGYIVSYRAYRLPWVGRPTTTPDAFACTNSTNQTSVYMSWLGATEHKLWKIFAGSSNVSLTEVARVPKKGFETEATIAGTPSYVRVEAYGCNSTHGVSSVVSVAASC